MSKAFLSHSSKQKPIVEYVANKIGRDNCVYDKYTFEVGMPTLEEIYKGLENTDLFVLFLSNDALLSEWVKKEIQHAKSIKDGNNSKQLLILNIDPTVSHNDSRIPKWLAETYNLRPITELSLIYKKVNGRLRDVAILNHPYIVKKEEIFVGRNDLMTEFEKSYYNLDLIKPSGIVVSGFEGVGRKKFIKNALDKAGKLNKFHEHISISLDSRDSIEDFILRIEDLNLKSALDVISKIKTASIEEKIQYAKHLLLSFQNVNEVLFVLDKGCIIQPNKEVASWFKQVISSPEFHNSTCVIVISFFRPHITYDQFYSKVKPFHVNELSPVDRQILLVKYSELMEISPSRENMNKILSKLNGMPLQIFQVAMLIKDHGSEWVANNINGIIKYDDVKVYYIIDMVKNQDELSYNVLLFISQFEFISFDFVYRIFGRTEETNNALEVLYVYGIYDKIGSDKEYIKVHHVISDYVTRAKILLPDEIKESMKREINKTISDGPDFPDASEILVTIKSLILQRKRIPDNIFIPSVALRTIIELYNQRKHEDLLPLADKVLQNFRKYDEAIVRDIRYWTAMSYARLKNSAFFDHLKHFEGADYSFLLGFYRRVEGKYKEAEKLFKESLEADPYSQKARRELVNVLLSQRKYSEAVNLARENYERNRLNAFHIQGYFISILRKPTSHPDERGIIDELMENIKISHDFNAEEINRVMEGEYEYYVKGNFEQAVKLLRKASETAVLKDYPIRALHEIYNKRGIKSPYENWNYNYEAEETVPY